MRKFYVLLLLLFASANVKAQPTISYQSFLPGLSAPIEVVNAGDGTNRLFIVQQNGIIRVYDPANGGLQSDPFLDMSSLVLYSGEQGLLSMAFHPGYETNGYFFVYYNNTAGEITLTRFSVSANRNRANSGSNAELLTIAKPFTNHNGGHLQFGQDGHLYFATGDGGSANDPYNNAQDSTSLLGKMIRINVDNFTTPPYYTVPASNPFVGVASYDSRIWARGLRNPFRWSFDRLTGDMWIGDVGQGAREEINYRPASSAGGENYGWRCYEGSIRNPNLPPCNPVDYVPPVFDYSNPPSGGASVVGGYVYRGAEYPFFQGWYIATDVYSNTIYLLRPNGSGGFAATQQAGTVGFVVSFGEAEDGTLYAVSQGTNTVYKVVATAAALPLVLQQFSAAGTPDGTVLKWTTTAEELNTKFVIAYSADGRQFTNAGEVTANGNANGYSYSFAHRMLSDVPLFYRLQILEANSSRYSSVVKVAGRGTGVKVYPTVVRDGRFFISTNSKIEEVQVVNGSGMMVLKKRLAQGSNPMLVALPVVPGGVYFVRILSGATSSLHKIMVE
jgi:glucose/arabinose dehydrogenase